MLGGGGRGGLLEMCGGRGGLLGMYGGEEVWLHIVTTCTIYVIVCAVQLLNKMPLLLTHQTKHDLGQVIQVSLVIVRVVKCMGY